MKQVCIVVQNLWIQKEISKIDKTPCISVTIIMYVRVQGVAKKFRRAKVYNTVLFELKLGWPK